MQAQESPSGKSGWGQEETRKKKEGGNFSEVKSE